MPNSRSAGLAEPSSSTEASWPPAMNAATACSTSACCAASAWARMRRSSALSTPSWRWYAARACLALLKLCCATSRSASASLFSRSAKSIARRQRRLRGRVEGALGAEGAAHVGLGPARGQAPRQRRRRGRRGRRTRPGNGGRRRRARRGSGGRGGGGRHRVGGGGLGGRGGVAGRGVVGRGPAGVRTRRQAEADHDRRQRGGHQQHQSGPTASGSTNHDPVPYAPDPMGAPTPELPPTMPARAAGLARVELDGEAVVFDAAHRRTHRLNPDRRAGARLVRRPHLHRRRQPRPAGPLRRRSRADHRGSGRGPGRLRPTPTRGLRLEPRRTGGAGRARSRRRRRSRRPRRRAGPRPPVRDRAAAPRSMSRPSSRPTTETLAAEVATRLGSLSSGSVTVGPGRHHLRADRRRPGHRRARGRPHDRQRPRHRRRPLARPVAPQPAGGRLLRRSAAAARVGGAPSRRSDRDLPG